MSNPKRAKCPTCGKFLNNNVAALREQVNILTDERDKLREFLTRSTTRLYEAIAQRDKAKADALKWEKSYNEKNATCEELMAYDHWLANRNLWQRIINVLERPAHDDNEEAK